MNAQTSDPVPPAERQRAKTAIVVDDYPGITLIIAPCLQDLGYKVLAATNGREAQAIIVGLGVAGVDLLITDLDMPEVGGDELARWFRQVNPGARVLVMSAVHGATQLGRDVMFLKKPFSLISLAARVGELAETWEPPSGGGPNEWHQLRRAQAF